MVENARGQTGESKGERALPGLRPIVVPPRAIVLPHVVHAKLQAARAQHLPLETGGFLIGLRRGPHLEITGATLQGDEDRASSSRFERADKGHRQSVLAAWEADAHRTTLIGDWHSHPQGDGSPSGTDRGAWRKLAQTGKADFVGLILGDDPMPRVFLVRRHPPLHHVVEEPLFADEADDLIFGRACDSDQH